MSKAVSVLQKAGKLTFIFFNHFLTLFKKILILILPDGHQCTDIRMRRSVAFLEWILSEFIQNKTESQNFSRSDIFYACFCVMIVWFLRFYFM